MRLLLAICIVVGLVGCGSQPSVQTIDHSLTPAQIERQQSIIRDADLLFEHDKMVGMSIENYSELILLANATAFHGSETAYLFIIPGVSDDGSDGEFVIWVEMGEISRCNYSSIDS